MKENKSTRVKKNTSCFFGVRWALLLYDLFIYTIIAFLLLYVVRFNFKLTFSQCLCFSVLSYLLTVLFRMLFKIYNQVWRFGGIQSYIRLLVSDAVAFLASLLVTRINALHFPAIVVLVFFSVQLLFALAMRMIYRFAFKCGGRNDLLGKVLRAMLLVFSGNEVLEAADFELSAQDSRTNIAIIGAGSTGTTLADELITNPHSKYKTVLFVDKSPDRIGRSIYNIKIIGDDAATPDFLKTLGVQTVVIAIPNMSAENKKSIYDRYTSSGIDVKIYDFPLSGNSGINSSSKKQLREVSIEELLFRSQLNITDEKTIEYYSGKTIMITGGGGSIGSELCRQIAKMSPYRIVIVDEYENGAYDIQQELKIAYGPALRVFIEIISVCDYPALERVFEKYKPDIVLHAAAHKHVPLMEHNCCEAIANNVFGTLNTVKCAEKYGTGRFIMISTDKAVNPTNVMGATKRMCEMIILSRAASGSSTVFSATRFGNVLGSAGSVIPLFRKQIKNGGPVTITDKRIIRYFMSIPEASQLVLKSGAIGKNGELFVLDMGKPIKILDLAENMIRMSGFEPYKEIEIRETGLRPGEKLYEELLVKSENLDKTENDLIFIERDKPFAWSEIEEKLEVLKKAVEGGNDDSARSALKSVVPSFRSPEEVNKEAAQSAEMKNTLKV